MSADSQWEERGALRIMIATGAVLVAALLATAATVDSAEAKRIKGTAGADQLEGAKKRDTIKGRAGNDILKGRAGKDRVSGGAGNDTAKGGRDRDVLKGGNGDDFLDAVDKTRDKRVHAGSGTNSCRLDQADLPIATGCSKIVIPGAGGDGGGNGSGGGVTGGPGLSLTSASGLKCGSALPLCPFQIEGTGADSLAGQVTGGGGVRLVAGGAVSIEDDGSWSAAGVYGCTADGYLHVEVGREWVDAPVTCTTP